MAATWLAPETLAKNGPPGADNSTLQVVFGQRHLVEVVAVDRARAVVLSTSSWAGVWNR